MSELKETGSLIPGFSTADIIAYAALSRFDIEIPELVKKTWHDIMHVGNHLDAVLDGDYGANGHVDLDAILDYSTSSDQQLGELGNDEATAAIVELVRDFQLLGLTPEQYEDIKNHSREVMQGTKATAAAKSVEELATARRYEGRVFGQLFTDVIPKAYRTEQFDRFKEWLACVGSVSELIDSFWDMPKDAKQSNIQIEPTWPHRLALLAYAYPELKIIGKDVSPGIIGKLAVKTALMGINRSGKLNRYRNK